MAVHALLHALLRGALHRGVLAVREAQAVVRGLAVTPAVSLRGIGKRYKISPTRASLLKEALSFGRVKRSHDFWALSTTRCWSVSTRLRPSPISGSSWTSR